MTAFDKTREVLGRIAAASSSDAIIRELLKVSRQWGLDHVLAGAPPRRAMDGLDIGRDVLLMSWPEEWSKRYFERNYISIDPIIRQTVTSSRAFTWSNIYASYRSRSPELVVANEATSVGLRNGYTVPLVSIEGRTLGISLGGDIAELPDEACKALNLVATFALAHAAMLQTGVTPGVAPNLTDRERDCLSWAAEGKTEWEIGQILSIAESTVDSHLSRVRAKLGANTRTQAVAIALRKGAIS